MLHLRMEAALVTPYLVTIKKTLVLLFILFSDVSEEEFRLLCTLISLIVNEKGIIENYGIISEYTTQNKREVKV